MHITSVRHLLGTTSTGADAPAPAVLEQLAARLRSGAATLAHLGASREARWFPLPDGTQTGRPTGRNEVRVEYDLVEVQQELKAYEAEWARLNPDLVPEYVKSLPEKR